MPKATNEDLIFVDGHGWITVTQARALNLSDMEPLSAFLVAQAIELRDRENGPHQ